MAHLSALLAQILRRFFHSTIMMLQSLTMYNGTLPQSRWMWLITTTTFQPCFSRAALFLPFHIFFYNLIGLFCSSERTEPTLVWRTCVHSTQSKTIGSREWFIWKTMLTSREKSVGLFKVAHGDLLGVMFVSVGYIGIFLKKKAARQISLGIEKKIWDLLIFIPWGGWLRLPSTPHSTPGPKIFF